MTLILGSSSPRRKEILNFFSIPFAQVSPKFNEESVEYRNDPSKYVLELSEGKSKSFQGLHADELLLTADTVVYYEGAIFNKPKDYEQAFDYLSRLQGNWHWVYTAMTLSNGHRSFSRVAKTRLLFHSLEEQQIHAYLQHTRFLDKAGGYTIQNTGSLLLSRIEGCYYNVLGLPVTILNDLFACFDKSLWDHLKIRSNE